MLGLFLFFGILTRPAQGGEGDSIAHKAESSEAMAPAPTEFDAGEEVSLDQAHRGDLYLAGRTVKVNKPVHGDLVAAGETIELKDRVGEDLMVSGRKVSISGRVDDDIRSFAAEVDIEGTVVGDLIVFGGELRIHDGAKVQGMLKVYGGEVKLAGTVEGDVDIAGGKFEHQGTVKGDLRLRTGSSVIGGTVMGKSFMATRSLEMQEGAAFHDHVKYWRRKGEVDLSPYMKDGEAELDPALKDQVMGDVGWTVLLFGFWMAWTIYILSAALILFLLNYFLTRSFKRAGIALEHLGKSLGFGALYVIGLPLLCIILLLTVIGAPIALVGGTIWGLSMLFTHLLSAVVVTHWIQVRYNKAWDRTYLFLVSLVLYVVIKALSLIPFIGFLFSILLVLACYGALLLARRALFTNRPMVRI